MIIDISRKQVALGLTIILFILALLLYRYIFNNNNERSQHLDNETLCGEMLSWDEVNKVFPKYAKAKVIDVDTRLSFQIQRRGGSRHADVQPLTSNDTAIMKSIYSGKWSWKRKAVIIELDSGKRIAASMNGMPHGQGAIENDFDGHFCIHFKDCKTHGSNKVDLAHQMMIWKSANMLDDHFQTLGPEDIIAVFFIAIDQQELNIVSKLLNTEVNVKPLLKNLEMIESIKIDKIKNIEGNTFSVDIRMVYKDTNREFRKNISINTTEKMPYWKIDANSIIPLFDKNTWVTLDQISNNTWEEEDLEVDVIME